MRFYLCYFLLLTSSFSFLLNALDLGEISKEPIDVVIPCTYKDLSTLDLCIEGIKTNCSQIRRVVTVSSEPLTDTAEWFDEKNFPFDKYTVALEMLGGDETLAKEYCLPGSRVGWYYQQLLKLYAPFVIPEISSNVLILDADTIFLNPVEFINSSGHALYNPGTENHEAYFHHASRLIPGFTKIFPHYSGISHHMLFQRPMLENICKTVENIQRNLFWKAFCQCVGRDQIHVSGASEYEIYFNFAFSNSDQVEIRGLKWLNTNNIESIHHLKMEGYHYASCHAWLRN